MHCNGSWFKYLYVCLPVLFCIGLRTPLAVMVQEVQTCASLHLVDCSLRPWKYTALLTYSVALHNLHSSLPEIVWMFSFEGTIYHCIRTQCCPLKLCQLLPRTLFYGLVYQSGLRELHSASGLCWMIVQRRACTGQECAWAIVPILDFYGSVYYLVFTYSCNAFIWRTLRWIFSRYR